jgi:hypothetical protein
VRVRLYAGALAAMAETGVLNGGNAAALRRPDGAWEVLQFAEAELTGEDTYRLSHLLRGVAGSEWAMGDPLPAGAPFVLLDGHLVRLARGLDALGRPMQLRIVAAGRDHGDPAAVALTATPGDTALRPLAPADVRGRRTAAGIELSWVRRARRNVTSTAHIPLDEPFEAYELDILSGATVLRTLRVDAPNALYIAAAEAADFGGVPQSQLAVRVAQLSATVGRGRANETIIKHLA